MIHRVSFAQTDMAGIMHFSNFFRLMEDTEHAFLRSVGLSVMMHLEGRQVGFPRVHASCDYRRPLRFEDEVEVEAQIAEIGEKSLRLVFVFRKPHGGEEVARGAFVTVCVERDTVTGAIQSVPLPALITDRLIVHRAE